MKRLILILALIGALGLTGTAAAWDGVDVKVSFPERALAGRATTLYFHVFLGGRPLDLATVGPRDASLRPTVVFRKGSERVRATARRTARPGVYRVTVVLPSAGRWTYSFEYAGLLRSFRVAVPYS